MAALIMAFIHQKVHRTKSIKGTEDNVERAKRLGELEEVKKNMRTLRGIMRLLTSISEPVEQHYSWISSKLLWKGYEKDGDLDDSDAYAWETIKKDFEDSRFSLV